MTNRMDQRHMNNTTSRPRLLPGGRAVILAVLGGLVVPLAFPVAGLAKTFGVTGTIDCGLPSGKRCTIGDTVTIRTSDISGSDENVAVDISWIKRFFEEEDFDQDDA